MRSPALLPMALRLRRRGFAPIIFSYSTLWRAPSLAMERLAMRLYGFGGGPVHLVAHSLGGLIAAETLNRYQQLPTGRLVCLGSPIAGSGAARGLVQSGAGFLSGRSGPLLRVGIGQVPPGRAVAMIAGSRSMGLGRFFGRFQEDNDGTVAVGETRLPGLAAHVVIRSSHSGLIVSAEAASMAARYLATGSF